MALADGHPVGLAAERDVDQSRVGILGGQPHQDGVVRTDGVHLSLLEHDQAVRFVVHRPQLDVLLQGGQVLQRRRARRRTDALAAEVLGTRDGRVVRYENLLVGLVVDGREVDLLLASAIDGHRLGHDVHLAVLHGLHAVRVRHDDVADVLRIRRAEDGLADLLQHGDVEARQRPRHRVAVAPQIGVVVDADPEVAAGLDLGHVGACRHVAGGGHGRRRCQTGGGVARLRGGGWRRLDDLGPLGQHHQGLRRRRADGGRRPARAQQDRRHGDGQDSTDSPARPAWRAHRYSAMRGCRPSNTSATTRIVPTASAQISPSRSDDAFDVPLSNVD